MNRLLFAQLLSALLLLPLSAAAQTARKKYCSICNQADGIREERARTGTCARAVGSFEVQVQMAERDDKTLDLAPFRALLEQCRADGNLDEDLNRADSFPDGVATLFKNHDPMECVTSTGRCMFELQLAELRADRSIALIREQAVSPVAERAKRFQETQTELEALPQRLASDFDKLAARAKEFQDNATRFRKDSLVVADAEVQRGLKACGYALMFDPKHAGCLKQKAALEAMAVAFEKEREAFYATAFHKQNLGKALFTADEDKLGSESAGDFKTSFRADEPLAGVVYLRYPVGMMSGDVGATTTVSVTFEAEGKRLGGAAWFIAPDDDAHAQAWVSFVAMPPSAKEAADMYTTSDLANALAALPEGTHQVKVTVGVLNADGSKGVEAASGTFEYDASTGREKAQGVARALAGRVLDEARMPKAAMKDARLDKAMLAEAGNNEFGDKPLRLVTTDKAFTITRNWLGVILRRSIHTAVATRGKDGSCMVRQIEFTQQYEGKNYGAPTMTYPSDEFPIRCENVKK